MEKPISFRSTLLLLAPLGAFGCAAADDIQPEDFTSAELSAEDAPGEPPMGVPPRPPDEVFAACEGVAAGAACTVTLPERSLDGTCRQGPPGEEGLACVPAGLPPMPPPHPRGHRGPPREALAACANLAADATCSFELGGRTVEGACWAPPAMTGAPLACAPPEIRNGQMPVPPL